MPVHGHTMSAPVGLLGAAQGQPPPWSGTMSLHAGTLRHADTSSNMQNQQNIATACSSSDSGSTFANTSVLLDACAGFLSNGELTSLGTSPQVLVRPCCAGSAPCLLWRGVLAP